MYCSSIFRSYCLLLFFFVCLLVCGFSYHLRSFHSYENVTIADVGLKIFTYSPHSWPLNSDGSLAYHTYCDTGHPFICHLRGHVTLTITAERLAVKLSFYDLDLSRLRLEHPTFRQPGERSNPLRQCFAHMKATCKLKTLRSTYDLFMLPYQQPRAFLSRPNFVAFNDKQCLLMTYSKLNIPEGPYTLLLLCTFQ